MCYSLALLLGDCNPEQIIACLCVCFLNMKSKLENP